MPGAAELDRLAAFATELADAAGAVIRRYYRQPIAIDHKTDDSPVTVADREAELVLRELIGRTFPAHGIEGEEFGIERGDAEFVWSLDPIDGTKSFIIGRPMFGTLIALAHRGRPVLGVIDQCILGERWLGVAGRPSTWNGTPIQVRPCPSLARATLCVTTLQMFKTAALRAAYERVERAVALPMYGGDCYAYGLLAMGTVDVIVEADLDRHDYLALIPVIEGAGGMITDWRGHVLGPDASGQVLAAGDARVHAEAIARLAAD